MDTDLQERRVPRRLAEGLGRRTLSTRGIDKALGVRDSQGSISRRRAVRPAGQSGAQETPPHPSEGTGRKPWGPSRAEMQMCAGEPLKELAEDSRTGPLLFVMFPSGTSGQFRE